MTVIITGFEPYGKYKINPSSLIAQKLNGSIIDNEKILSFIVPVAYRKIKEIIPKLIEENKPKVFLGLGLAGGRPNITVERLAINIMDSEKPDNEGYKAFDEPIFKDGPAAFFATIPIKQIIKSLRENKIPAMVSNSAGTFLCNALFYTASYTTWKNKMKTLVGFMHLPLLPEQVLDKAQPSLTEEQMIRAVKIALNESIKAWK